MHFIVVAILLGFLYASCCLDIVGLVGASGNQRIKEKHEEPRTSTPVLLSRRHKTWSDIEDEDNRVSHVAMYHTEPGTYYGTRAKIGIWGSPNQGRFQESGASILVTSDELLNFTAIEAGFHVYPDLYNNTDVHFFIRWTKDNYKSTGCFNLECKGFVPASGVDILVPGQAVAPRSTYGGVQHYISVRLHMDPTSGDWVLYRDDDRDKPAFLGHFPKELCPKLSAAAPLVAWTGFTSYPYNEPGPPMGSGHFPEEDEGKASSIEYIELFDKKGHAYEPPIIADLIPVFDKPDCYKLTVIYYGFIFYYGGPSGCIG